ncbi:MAG: DUF2892 domain-containing protein [Ignavibacteriales bacterium]|nr:DUF2892 domain-containing protein [Ignavibacteriales bacterium]
MPEEKNVGHMDSVVRIILGIVCAGLVAYHFILEAILPLYGLIPVIILIPFFLKTGLTKVCPVMKAMNVSTIKKSKG